MVDAGCIILSFLFVLVGIISEAVRIDLRLSSATWLLLGLYFAVVAIGPILHVVSMKNLYGIESENKNK